MQSAVRTFLLLGTVFVLSACAIPIPIQSAATMPVESAPAEPEQAMGGEGAFLTPLGTYTAILGEEGGSEIVAYDPETQRLFSTNGANNTVDILDAAAPTALSLIQQVDLTDYGVGINSVAVGNGVVAVAVEAEAVDANGQIVFMDPDGQVLASVQAGVLPDMVTFTPDGNTVLAANEGEPNDDYTVDPPGSITLVDLSDGLENLTQDHVREASFQAFTADDVDAAVRVFGPGASLAQDLEPEYIAVSPDSSTAYVSLQENNALAIVDIATAQVTAIAPLGFKDHSQPQVGQPEKGMGLDASNEDGAINIRHWPVLGMYQPDAIATFQSGGETYIVSANEGDARDYDGFSEEVRVADLTLDPDAYPQAETLQAEENLGRLKTTTATGDTDGDGDIDQIYSYGARSFSIWDSQGNLVWDSGDQFAQTVARLMPDHFNAQHGSEMDNRSDDKGGEPEAVTVGTIDGRTYAFIGLERQSGIFVYDVTDPTAPQFVDFVSNWVPIGSIDDGSAGDVSPEGMVFISADESPTGDPLLVVANEVSSTVTVYRVNP